MALFPKLPTLVRLVNDLLSLILRALDDRSALHHKSNGLHGSDVYARIADDGDDVGQRTLSSSTSSSLRIEQLIKIGTVI
jgi:hypothetical protein